ncbi:BnaCnng61370D [Brassica napus]|uniref:BnaCnng61370D protein n=1 Tax=Brassica napus TaxID=3708 RepID=A0A078JTN7_BRANA|nr:BnaCnng61370D [Brassica napus]
MDSPVSRSDSSSEPGSPVPLPLSCVYVAPPLVGPASLVGGDELAEWRGRYSLPSSVILRVPTPEERASSDIPREIAVYEAFFDSGLRGTIPALIVGLCNLFEISPPQLNPPAWRILIAIQNLGDLEYLSLGDFIFVPAAACRSWRSSQKVTGKGRFLIKKWQGRYTFMMFLGSSYRWNFIGRNSLILLQVDHFLTPCFYAAGTHPAPAEGERAVLRARQLPVDRRQVNFLVSETVLRCSSLWSKRPLALSSFLS